MKCEECGEILEDTENDCSWCDVHLCICECEIHD